MKEISHMPHNHLTLIFFIPFCILLPTTLLNHTLLLSILHPHSCNLPPLPTSILNACIRTLQARWQGEQLLQDQMEEKAWVQSWVFKAPRVFPGLASPSQRCHGCDILSLTDVSDLWGLTLAWQTITWICYGAVIKINDEKSLYFLTWHI